MVVVEQPLRVEMGTTQSFLQSPQRAAVAAARVQQVMVEMVARVVVLVRGVIHLRLEMAHLIKATMVGQIMAVPPLPVAVGVAQVQQVKQAGMLGLETAAMVLLQL